MAKIEIDPLTGAPVIKPSTPELIPGGIVSQPDPAAKPDPNTPNSVGKTNDAKFIVDQSPISDSVSSKSTEKDDKTVETVEQEVTNTPTTRSTGVRESPEERSAGINTISRHRKLAEIKQCLQGSGMDSQQQDKTYARIVEILGW